VSRGCVTVCSTEISQCLSGQQMKRLQLLPCVACCRCPASSAASIFLTARQLLVHTDNLGHADHTDLLPQSAAATNAGSCFVAAATSC
jgi:hypothetical protein